ncbi:hypothetical protein FVE85_7665 [Porphyridium purpureum]|uniref:Uncharacterized protein n=1 Tax=Porphyridium purpureum TaxID=35688 RepID=A0A5J4ZAC7_PORPP|nr:hypothetical protein FVE85_7665 [Porphyridium purpureum]|eukprot:POR5010..scf295_1
MQGIHASEDGCPILRMRVRTAPVCQWNALRAFSLLLKQRTEERYITLGAPRMSISVEAGGGQHYDRHGKAEPETSNNVSEPQPGVAKYLGPLPTSILQAVTMNS